MPPTCEDDCERLSQTDPDALIAAFATMDPTLLTFAAEYLRNAPSEIAVPALLPLLGHAKAYVREGAVYGLASHFSDVSAVDAVRRVAREDPSPGVHDAAFEALELYENPA